MISILILTYNEEKDLPNCIRSVQWSDDIHVLDSGSTDSTQQVAVGMGAQVTVRKFDDWSSHQNWAMQNIPFKHPWVFYLDADERMTPALQRNVLEIARVQTQFVSFRVQRRDFLYGTWLRHAQATSFYQRLFRPDKMRYARLVNPVSLPDGEIGDVSGYLDHYPFSKGLSHWVDRHNKYSTFEARQTFEGKAEYSWRAALFGKDTSTRRFHQKEIFYRMPFRPLVKFLGLYIGKRGFLDGQAGLTYSILQSIYEYMIVLKQREMRAAARNDEQV